MNNSALKLFHELMKKGWIDRNDNSLMWNLVEDNEARDELDQMGIELGFEIIQAQDRIYMVPTQDNDLFLKNNVDYRADIKATNEVRSRDLSFIDAKRKYAGFELSEKREPGKVHFTTIRKFKGLEAEAILVVDASMIGLKSEEDRRLLYVGVSRAKNYLEIAMNQDIADSELGDYLHALNPNRSLPRNKKGLKRLLNVDI